MSSRSYPSSVPSRSMLVRRISPAPRFSIFAAHPTASIPVGLRPPWVKTSHPPPSLLLASMATTMHWLPNLSEARLTKSGSVMAAVLIVTLSAPASRSSLTSSTVLSPPPTVRGTNTSLAVRPTTSIMVFLFSWEAVISRNVISSAPSSLYFFATSTGSPASLRLTKRTPFTTLPSFTSRHGIILFETMFIETFVCCLLGR